MPASSEGAVAVGLEVRGIRCERGGRPLFDALDLTVARGTALMIVGPNGSGKTTLLRALAGLTEAAVQRIAWQGAPVPVRGAAWRSQIAYVGHKPGHKEELTVAENLALACALDTAATEPEARARALERVGLAGRSELPVKRLSQGQKQRLALARLTLSRREIWLLDEPAAALDADARRLLGAILAEHLDRGGVAAIATHERIDLPAERATQLRLGAPAAHSPALSVHDAAFMREDEAGSARHADER